MIIDHIDNNLVNENPLFSIISHETSVRVSIWYHYYDETKTYCLNPFRIKTSLNLVM